MSLFTVLSNIPSNEQIKFFFGSAIDLMKEPEMKPITISVKYKNDKGKNQQNKKFIIDIEPWKGISNISSEPPLNKMASDLHELKEIFRKTISGFDVPLLRIQSETLLQKEKESERKEAEEYFRQQNKENP